MSKRSDRLNKIAIKLVARHRSATYKRKCSVCKQHKSGIGARKVGGWTGEFVCNECKESIMTKEEQVARQFPEFSNFVLEMESVDGNSWSEFKASEDNLVEVILGDTGAIKTMLRGGYGTVRKDGVDTRFRLTPKTWLKRAPLPTAQATRTAEQMYAAAIKRVTEIAMEEGDFPFECSIHELCVLKDAHRSTPVFQALDLTNPEKQRFCGLLIVVK